MASDQGVAGSTPAERAEIWADANKNHRLIYIIYLPEEEKIKHAFMKSKKIITLLFFISLIIIIGINALLFLKKYYTQINPTQNSTLTMKQPVINENLKKTVEGCTINPYNQNKLKPEDTVIDLRGGAVCQFKIHSNLPIYTFKLIGNPKFNTIDQIIITKKNHPETLQTLEAKMDEPLPPNAKFFTTEDINFDGYNDIKMMTWRGATGNKGYDYWLFQPKERLFLQNNELSNLSNPTPHPETKTITTDSVGGMAGKIYNIGTYKFDDNGKLILIREEKQDWVEDKGYFLKTISERKDDLMVIVSKQIISKLKL